MPAPAPARAHDLECRAIRAELLAILFGPASEGALALARELSAGAAEAPGAQLELLQLAALLAQLDVPTWDSHRVQLFSVGTSVDCPAFETAYFAAEAHRQSHRMADLAGLYRAFGVVPAPSLGRPDDLPVELEFLAFMLRKEAFAVLHGGAPRVAQVQKGLRILLRDHLGRWIPLLAGRLEQRAAGTFFGPAARLLQQVVDDEAARLGIDAIEPAPGFDPAAWETPRSHGPELGVSSFVSLDQLVTGEVAP